MHSYPVIITLVLLTVPFSALGKHPAPPQVGAVTNNGVRYVAPNDNGLRAYVEAWSVSTGKKLWSRTIVRHHYIPPFGTECGHYEYLNSMSLRGGLFTLTTDRGRTYLLDPSTRGIRRVKPERPKHLAGNDGFAALLADRWTYLEMSAILSTPMAIEWEHFPPHSVK